MISYEIQFLYALIITLISEIIVSVFIFKKFLSYEISLSRIITASAIVSILTLPYFWFVLPFFITDHTWFILIGEFGIVIIEAYLLYFQLGILWKHAGIVSIVANTVSIIIGLLVLK